MSHTRLWARPKKHLKRENNPLSRNARVRVPRRFVRCSPLAACQLYTAHSTARSRRLLPPYRSAVRCPLHFQFKLRVLKGEDTVANSEPARVLILPSNGLAHLHVNPISTVHSTATHLPILKQVRFSIENEFDEVAVTWYSESEVRCITPDRNGPGTAHITAANDGMQFSGYPLVYTKVGPRYHPRQHMVFHPNTQHGTTQTPHGTTQTPNTAPLNHPTRHHPNTQHGTTQPPNTALLNVGVSPKTRPGIIHTPAWSSLDVTPLGLVVSPSQYGGPT